MDAKTLSLLEFPKVLEKLAGYAAFSASAELARAIQPTSELEEAQRRQKITTEARFLLSVYSDFTIGGARDVRRLVDLANHGGTLSPSDLLDVKYTLVSGREIARVFERRAEQFPTLAEIGARMQPPPGLIEAITRVVSDDAQVLDSASARLSTLRHDIKIAHERLLSRLDRYLGDPKMAAMLQEGIITQRGGRYVIPLRAEFKGQVRSIVHDQSSSGATLFVEPLAIVELNNRWQELQLAERDEVHRVLAEVSGEVGKGSILISMMVEALAEMDLALMCAKYAEDLHAAEPILLSIQNNKENRDQPILLLYQARHPLLDPEKVVPIDLQLDSKTFSVVITGPNTGGKTVSLKTSGLMVVMAQSGLHIPAGSGSLLRVFENLYADIGDEQSIEQSLSTFSGHVTNIVRILKHCSWRSLVLFDELGAGTDPQEGAALAHAILSDLVKRNVPSLVATHYPELKIFAHNTAGAINASMEFDLQTLRPTYHLLIGLPGRSNAFLISERLGMPTAIIEAARAMLGTADLKADDMLGEIHHQRDLARHERKEVEKSQRENERLRKELQKRLEHIEEERLKIMQETRSQAQEELDSVLEELDTLRKTLRKSNPGGAPALRDLQDQAQDIQEQMGKRIQAPEPLEPIEHSQPVALKVGERVRLRTLGMDGVILTIGAEEIEVQAGALRMRARIDDIQRINKSGETKPEAEQPRSRLVVQGNVTPYHPSPGLELDLRGERSEEALERLQKHLENAYLAGLPMVRIIHGKGTGKLREAVRQALRRSQHVKAWENGLDGEGGEGVTIARIASE